MKLTACEVAMLRRLGETPFADCQDLAALSGRSSSAIYEAVARLEGAGLVSSLAHGTQQFPSSRRAFLTAEGVRRLARVEGRTVEEVLHGRPLSAHWRRLLLERLDAVAAVYRLAGAVAGLSWPVRLRWYRASPLDAVLLPSGGRVLGVVRQGLLSGRTPFSKRLRRLFEGPLPGALLVVLPDDVRLRHARRLLRGAPVTAFVALEHEVVRSGADGRIWRIPSLSGVLTLREALSVVRQGGMAPVERPPRRSVLPGALLPDDRRLIASLLRPAEKRALDALYDWPWITVVDLAGLLGVSPARASDLVLRLRSLGFARRVPIAGQDRLVPSDRGLTLLARRDRASVGTALKRWSASPADSEEALDWRNVSGSRSRQLLRNLEHTEAVHHFLAALARQAGDWRWDVVQLDPPHRASRYFRHHERLHSVRPDAFGLLDREGQPWPFFLEWERRAVRPATMRRRLAPYLHYYATERPLKDHGAWPLVLIVFEGELPGVHFLRVAREEMARTGVEVPLRVSHRQAVAELGPLEPTAWQQPGSPPHATSAENRGGERHASLLRR